MKMNPVICKWFTIERLLYLLKRFTLLYTLIVFSDSDSVSFCRKTRVYKMKISKQLT